MLVELWKEDTVIHEMDIDRIRDAEEEERNRRLKNEANYEMARKRVARRTSEIYGKEHEAAMQSQKQQERPGTPVFTMFALPRNLAHARIFVVDSWQEDVAVHEMDAEHAKQLEEKERQGRLRDSQTEHQREAAAHGVAQAFERGGGCSEASASAPSAAVSSETITVKEEAYPFCYREDKPRSLAQSLQNKAGPTAIEKTEEELACIAEQQFSAAVKNANMAEQLELRKRENQDTWSGSSTRESTEAIGDQTKQSDARLSAKDSTLLPDLPIPELDVAINVEELRE